MNQRSFGLDLKLIWTSYCAFFDYLLFRYLEDQCPEYLYSSIQRFQLWIVKEKCWLYRVSLVKASGEFMSSLFSNIGFLKYHEWPLSYNFCRETVIFTMQNEYFIILFSDLLVHIVHFSQWSFFLRQGHIYWLKN